MMRGALAALVLFSLSSARAYAEASAHGPSDGSAARGFSLEYSGVSGCDDRARFTSEVIARAPNAREVSPTAADTWFRVELREQDSQVIGALIVRRADGEVSKRDVPKTSCEEAVRALALIAAVVLDARLGYRDAASKETTTRLDARAVQNDAPLPIVQSAMRARLGLVLRGMLESNLAPLWTAGVGFGPELWFDTRALLSPSLRVLGIYAQSGTEHTRYGDASFRFLALRLSGCPVRWPSQSKLALRPCVAFDLGELRATGTNTVDAQQSSITWFALGGGARLEWLLTSFAALEFEASAVVPTRRDRFLFEPDLVVHEMGPAGMSLNFSGVARLP